MTDDTIEVCLVLFFSVMGFILSYFVFLVYREFTVLFTIIHKFWGDLGDFAIALKVFTL